jgi:hypothetical protein
MSPQFAANHLNPNPSRLCPNHGQGGSNPRRPYSPHYFRLVDDPSGIQSDTFQLPFF